MDEILLILMRRGALASPVRMTTAELGRLASMSQQNASRKLVLLEKQGLISREKEGIAITKAGREDLADVYSSLKTAFEPGGFEVEGTVVRGLGEGKFYMSLEGYKKQIKEKVGFNPFPGTLNIRLEGTDMWKRKRILTGEPITISGFRDQDRTYGDLFAYRCTLQGRKCALIFPLRTHHGPEVMEIVCPMNVKKQLGIMDGDRIRVVL